jgi:hypothetical protein
MANTSNNLTFDPVEPPVGHLFLGLEVLLLRSEKRNFNRLYGDTQRRDFQLLEDKRLL